jgi:hypothetical protein
MRLQFLLLLATILPVHAEWTRFYMGPKGWNTGSVSSHTVAYFSRDVFLRPESCEDCTAEQRADAAKNSMAQVFKVGEVGGLEVYDVNYRYKQATAGKSLIVRTGADEYREVFYAQAYVPMTFSPTKIVSTCDKQTLVWLQVDFAGSMHNVEQYIVHLDPSGASQIDLAPVWDIARSLLPDGGALYGWTPEIFARADAFTFRVPVYANCRPFDGPSCNANIGGRVEVDFRLDGDHLTPLGRRYIP